MFIFNQKRRDARLRKKIREKMTGEHLKAIARVNRVAANLEEMDRLMEDAGEDANT